MIPLAVLSDDSDHIFVFLLTSNVDHSDIGVNHSGSLGPLSGGFESASVQRRPLIIPGGSGYFPFPRHVHLVNTYINKFLPFF